MIDRLGDFLQHNLVVLLAVILIPLKIVIVRFCRDREAEAAAILSIPEDLSYVALGLIVSDLLIPSGSLHRHFSGSKHVYTDITIVIGLNLSVAVLVHLIAQPAQKAYKRWRGAEAVRTPGNPQQEELPFAASAQGAVDHLVAHHFSVLAMLYGTQFAVVLLWLHWLAKVIANVQN